MAIAIDSTSSAGAAASAASPTPKAEADPSDRFLKLLVAQMKNQDPLNPLDNAEVTSQMAQISTVSGIEKLNKSVESMTSSFTQQQTMQGAALIGRNVVLDGNKLPLDAQGKGRGGFSLDAPADNVRVEILSSSGATLDTVKLGAQGAGQHAFDWAAQTGVDPKTVAGFRVTALAGGKPVAATPYMFDRVQAVLTGGAQLQLELQASGSVSYNQIKAFN